LQRSALKIAPRVPHSKSHGHTRRGDSICASQPPRAHGSEGRTHRRPNGPHGVTRRRPPRVGKPMLGCGINIFFRSKFIRLSAKLGDCRRVNSDWIEVVSIRSTPLYGASNLTRCGFGERRRSNLGFCSCETDTNVACCA